MNYIQVQEQDFDVQAEERALRQGNGRIGAIVSFIGIMRDFNQGDAVSKLYLEHYPAMTQKALQQIVQRAEERWSLEGVRLIHRVGELQPQDNIVLVMVASQHRGEAFQACEFIMDYLKTQAPFWKKEITAEGKSRWVEAKSSDQQALHKWS